MSKTIDVNVGDSILVGPEGRRGPAGSIKSTTKPETTDTVVWVDTSKDAPDRVLELGQIMGLQKKYENLIQNETSQSPSDAEIVDARGDFDLLSGRLNDNDTKVKAKPYYFNTVAEMKSSKHLKDGDCAITLGYYSVNDGGNATYKIRTKTSSDVDDGGSIHYIGTDLVAELIIENGTVNVLQFGAKGDGINNDYQSLNNMFKTISNNFNGTKIQIYLLENKTYLIENEDLFNGCKNRFLTDIKGRSKLLFKGFTGYCFKNVSLMFFTDFDDVIFESEDDELLRTFMLCNTDYSIQGLQFNNVFWNGKFDKVFELTGNGNNSEFIFNYCYTSMDSTWNSFLYQNKDNGSDDAVNFWFNNFRYLANSNFIHLEKGGHVKLNNCDFSRYRPTDDTYLYELGFANEYGLSSYGSTTFVDSGSRYELVNETSKIIKAFWQQAQIIFQNCDFSSSVHLHEVSNKVFWFESYDNNNIVLFDNCKLFGKFYTYAHINTHNVIKVKNCIIYGITNITDNYLLEKDEKYTNYYNINFENCKLFSTTNPYSINILTNLFNNFNSDINSKILSNVYYNESNTQPICSTNTWKTPIYNKAFIKNIYIIPYLNGNGIKKDLLIVSFLGNVKTIEESYITVDDNIFLKFYIGQSLYINKYYFRVTSTGSGNKIYLQADETNPDGLSLLQVNDEINIVVAKSTVISAGWDKDSAPKKIECNLIVYNDLKLLFTNEQTQFYGNIFVDLIN